MPLLPLLAALPAGPGAPLAVLCLAAAFAITRRDIDAHVTVR
jgi:hypothetical protein